MKKYFLILLFTIGTLPIYSQYSDRKIEIPDSIGKYIYELFMSRANIEQSDLSVSTNFLSDSVSLENALDYSNSYPTGAIKETWVALLKQADEYGLTETTTSYYNTFFKGYTFWGQENNPSYNYSIFIAFKNNNDIIAIHSNIERNGTSWSVQECSPELYRYSVREGSDYDFEQITETMPLENEASYLFNTTPTRSTNIQNNTKIPSISEFTEKIIQSLLSGKADNNLIPTKSEYMQVYGKDILRKIKEYIENNPEGDYSEIKPIFENPDLLYKQEITGNWQILFEQLKEEFNIEDPSILKPYHTQIEISNWDYKTGLGKATATISSSFSYNNKKAGIYFSGAIYENTWKIRHIQPFAFGIEEAVSIGAALDDLEE